MGLARTCRLGLTSRGVDLREESVGVSKFAVSRRKTHKEFVLLRNLKITPGPRTAELFVLAGLADVEFLSVSVDDHGLIRVFQFDVGAGVIDAMLAKGALLAANENEAVSEREQTRGREGRSRLVLCFFVVDRLVFHRFALLFIHFLSRERRSERRKRQREHRESRRESKKAGLPSTEIVQARLRREKDEREKRDGEHDR